MAVDGVYAGDVSSGDLVRVWQVGERDVRESRVWRVARVGRCGPNEVEVLFVMPDDSDQLVMNMNPGQILERVADGG